MKMQNELSSPSSGVVSEILVKAGSTVAAGTALLRLQPKAAEAQ
jgi:biotin carboxyl carrier protein